MPYDSKGKEDGKDVGRLGAAMTEMAEEEDHMSAMNGVAVSLPRDPTYDV